MKRLLILQNITHEGPGLFADVLKERGVAFTLINLDLAKTLPEINDFDILMILGGPDSANDKTAKIQSELRFVREWMEKGKPCLGICLGLQLMVKAMGGEVLRAPEKEIGFFDSRKRPYEITLTEAGESDFLLKDISASFPIFQLHGETVRLTSQMILLGRGEGCLNQIVRLKKNIYGIQGHVEVTKGLLESWVEMDKDLKEMNKPELLCNFQAMSSSYQKTGRQIFNNFLDQTL